MTTRSFETLVRVSDKALTRGKTPDPRVEMVPTRVLKTSPHNVRVHSKKQIDQIASSISRFGWTYPILIDENKNIIAGHGRLEAAKQLGLKNVPVISVSGLSDVEKRALALADNKIPANAGWDRAALASELGELTSLLPEVNLSLEITGFEPDEVDSLMSDLVDPERDPADEIPTIAERPITQQGDLWVLGNHRLLCGDATKAQNMRRLIGRDTAAMVFTDPPYNVRISSVQGRGRVRHREFVAASGEMSRRQFMAFLTDSLGNVAIHSADGSIHYVCMDWRHMGELLAAGEQVYDELKNVVVWNKTNAGQGSFYRSQHEMIFVFKKGKGTHTNNFKLGQNGRSRSNVWTYAGVNTFRTGRTDELSIHPTVKPVALIADAIRDCSRRGELIVDPFMGSGTTILAAERVGRRA